MPTLSYCLIAPLPGVIYSFIPSSFCNSASVQVKFSRPLVSTTEEEGQVIITVLAMGDLSSDFSIIVMAINGTSVGKLFSWNYSSVEM